MRDESPKDFRGLEVWQKAHLFVLAVYNYSDYFPQKEALGLTPELRREATSVAVHISTGFGRGADERRQAFSTARAAIERCRYYLILAKDLGYGDHPELMPQLEEINEMLKQYGAELAAPED
jgi:four helix bundle protein